MGYRWARTRISLGCSLVLQGLIIVVRRTRIIRGRSRWVWRLCMRCTRLRWTRRLYDRGFNFLWIIRNMSVLYAILTIMVSIGGIQISCRKRFLTKLAGLWLYIEENGTDWCHFRFFKDYVYCLLVAFRRKWWRCMRSKRRRFCDGGFTNVLFMSILHAVSNCMYRLVRIFFFPLKVDMRLTYIASILTRVASLESFPTTQLPSILLQYKSASCM